MRVCMCVCNYVCVCVLVRAYIHTNQLKYAQAALSHGI